MPKVSVIIPILDEEASIGKVIDAIPEQFRDDIICVDNGCRDRSVEIAEAKGARVVKEPRRGYGAAMWRGLQALNNPDIVVFLDGDLSDSPEEMTNLVAPVASGEADLVIGSRMLGTREPGALPPHSIFGNRLASRLLSLLFGIRCTDLGPFRAIAYQRLIALGMRDRGFGWTMEMQAKAAARGLRILETPVSYRRRIGRSKITGRFVNSCRAGWMILSTCLKIAAYEKFFGGKHGGQKR